MTDDRRDDLVRELARELPYEAPSEARREGVRASLLAQVEAAQLRAADAPRRSTRGLVMFGAGALAAAAVAIVIVRVGGHAPPTVATSAASMGSDAGAGSALAGNPEHATVEASTTADFEHSLNRTPAGADEQVRVHTGHLRLAVAGLGEGDRVRLVTGDAEVAGAGVYEVTVEHDSIRELTVRSGGAMLKVTGQAAVFLAAGQTWRAPVETASLELPGTAPTAIAATTSRSGSGKAMRTQTTASAPRTADSGMRATVAVSAAHSVPTMVSGVATATTTRADGGPRVTSPRVSRSPSATAELPAPRQHAAPVDAADAAPVPIPAVAAAPAVHSPSSVEQQFAAGWAEFRAGAYERAAADLGAAADAGEIADDPIGIDARYQQAVALSRAGQPAAAERAVAQFLAHAATSPRRGRAQLMLGRLLAARGDRDGAAAQFRAASADADPDVGAAARTALGAVERR